MIRKLTLAAGFGAGYVLGAKAGQQRYEQIVAKARELAGLPAVQEATTGLSQTASTLADRARETVNDKVETLNEKVSSTPSTGTAPATTTTTSRTGAKTGAAPMAGAAASGSAPDVSV